MAGIDVLDNYEYGDLRRSYEPSRTPDSEKPGLNMSIPLFIAEHAPNRLKEIDKEMSKKQTEMDKLRIEKQQLEELLDIVKSHQ